MSNKYLIYILASFLALIFALAGIIYFKSQEQKVTFTSEVPNIKIHLQNPKLLNLYLQQWRVFDKKLLITGRTPVKLQHINVILTPKEQPFDKFILSKTDKTVLQSIGIKLNKNTLTLLVYLNSKYILSQKPNREIANSVALATLLRLYNISNPVQSFDINDFAKAIYKKQAGQKEILYVEKK